MKVQKLGNRADFERKIEEIRNEVGTVQKFTPYHYRIHERLDIWPSTRKWHDLQTKKSGEVQGDIADFIIDYLNKKYR